MITVPTILIVLPVMALVLYAFSKVFSYVWDNYIAEPMLRRRYIQRADELGMTPEEMSEQFDRLMEMDTERRDAGR